MKKKLKKTTNTKVPNYMWKYLIGYNYFNVMDALMTTLMLMTLPVVELNPLMAHLIHLDFMTFLGVKVGLGLLSTLFAIRNKSFTLMKCSFFLYATVVTWNFIVLATYLNFAR